MRTHALLTLLAAFALAGAAAALVDSAPRALEPCSQVSVRTAWTPAPSAVTWTAGTSCAP